MFRIMLTFINHFIYVLMYKASHPTTTKVLTTLTHIFSSLSLHSLNPILIPSTPSTLSSLLDTLMA